MSEVDDCGSDAAAEVKRECVFSLDAVPSGVELMPIGKVKGIEAGREGALLFVDLTAEPTELILSNGEFILKPVVFPDDIDYIEIREPLTRKLVRLGEVVLVEIVTVVRGSLGSPKSTNRYLYIPNPEMVEVQLAALC